MFHVVISEFYVELLALDDFENRENSVRTALESTNSPLS